LKKQRDALKQPEVLKALDTPCPHCGKPLSISGGKIKIGGTITPEMEKKSETDYKEYQTKIAEINGKIQTIGEGIVSANAGLKFQTEAAEKLALPRTVTRDVAEIEAEISVIENENAMIAAVKNATELQKKIEKLEKIVVVLKPEGLRKTMLTSGLDTFNKSAADICKKANWLAVGLTENLDILYGKRDYRLLSESEKFRVRATLQIVCAGLDGSEMIVIDGADILDSKGRNGLFAVLNYIAIGTCVFMTLPEAEMLAMPDKMAKIGAKTYMIENGGLK